MKVMFLTPTLDAKVGHDFCASMYRTAVALKEAGIESDVLFIAGCAAMDRARDILIGSFLESDATHCMQVDSDLGWVPEDILRMLEHNVDFVSGVYPVKQDIPKFLVNFNNKRLKGLLGATGVPGGFCLISRSAIERMVEFFPDLIAMGESDGLNGVELSWLHTHEVKSGRVWGEDMVFCRRAIEAGIDIYVDPTINLRHWSGNRKYDHSLIGNLVKAK